MRGSQGIQGARGSSGAPGVVGGPGKAVGGATSYSLATKRATKLVRVKSMNVYLTRTPAMHQCLPVSIVLHVINLLICVT